MDARGQLPPQRSSRSYASIVRANTLNIPNGVLLLFGILTLTFGAWQDALFLGILVSNVAIGSLIRSKRALDRLASWLHPMRWSCATESTGGCLRCSNMRVR